MTSAHRRSLPFLACCIAASLLCGSAGSAGQEATPGGGRLRPPEAITCDRNHLTSWSGVVSGYRRENKQTWLQVNTDEDTVEQIMLDHHGEKDASAYYLIGQQKFTKKDWPKIERFKGMLITGTRAVVWVCDDGKTAPVVDWQPQG
jgi:hypothetical protein